MADSNTNDTSEGNPSFERDFGRGWLRDSKTAYAEATTAAARADALLIWRCKWQVIRTDWLKEGRDLHDFDGLTPPVHLGDLALLYLNA